MKNNNLKIFKCKNIHYSYDSKHTEYCSPIHTRKYFAFTLAEVLITLGVIGVVAAITMPTFVVNYQKKQMLTHLKKTYSVLNQAFKLSEIQNGEFDNWEDADIIGRHVFAEKYWVPFLNGAKYCANYVECGYKEVHPWNNLNGDRKNNYDIQENGANYFLSDGTFLRFSDAGILFDLNGGKNPNIYGKDVFLIDFDKKGLIAACPGMTDADIIDRCSSTTKDGICCLRRIINIDNWQVADDYPW